MIMWLEEQSDAYGKRLRLRRKKVDAAKKAVNERHYDKEKASKLLKEAKRSLWQFEKRRSVRPDESLKNFAETPSNVSRKQQRKQCKYINSMVTSWEDSRRENLAEERRSQRIIRIMNKK